MTSLTYKKTGFSRGSTRDGGDIGSSPIYFDRAIPSSLPPELQDFLKKCLTTNEHSRWTATQQLEHTCLKMQLQKGP
ncbi:unnamed protein product [Allacma fusca]|uniref:Uncharacterized protein n=1 Tax=Allacma fusca TaxID=39272 RepID=A0A8J2L9W2_9HEXA|nr:unnamed protein product [Allacma fusca]